jgi:transcriptional regulator with XRE-family HTH domain
MSELPLTRTKPDGSVVYVLTKLRKLVITMNVPQYQIAALCNIHPYTFSLYCQGKQEISDKHLAKLCEILDLAPDDIVGTEEYPIDKSDP